MLVDALAPGFARVSNPESSAGAKEYVPVNSAHEQAILAHQGNAEAGIPAGLFGTQRRVRFNCTYDVMGTDGKVTQMRAGFERVFDPKKEQMDDRACAGIAFKNPTWEQETLALPGKAFPTMEGWRSVRASRLQPAFPTSFGVRVGGR
jgi:hypothetical protein